mmetsp:Transcript_28305/g.89195  ORF Transcript_28305/g.89195 Transcript_28305/m.89195 type:complete len:244 (-) Transcript_28305:374-1105(-)
MRWQPIVLLHSLQHSLILREEDVLAGLLGAGEHAWGTADLTHEYRHAVQQDLHIPHTAAAVQPRLVVVPDPDHGEARLPLEVHGHRVRAARREGRQPNVQVVPGEIHLIEELVGCPRVVLVLGKHVDGGWVRGDLTLGILHDHGHAVAVEDLDACEPHEALVPPRGHKVENQRPASRYRGDHHALVRAEAAGHERRAHDRVRAVVGDKAVEGVVLVEVAHRNAQALEGYVLPRHQLPFREKGR